MVYSRHSKGIVVSAQRLAVEWEHANRPYDQGHLMADSDSAKVPRRGPMPSDLMGLQVLISSTSSSSDSQPSDALGVPSGINRIVRLAASDPDILARTS